MIGESAVKDTQHRSAAPGIADIGQIVSGMRVVCSKGGSFAVVDRVQGGSIVLQQDAEGMKHAIPTSWVTHVDDSVHVDRSAERAMRQWSLWPAEA